MPQADPYLSPRIELNLTRTHIFFLNEKSYESLIYFTDKEAEKINEGSDVLEYYKKNNCHLFKIIKNKKSNIILNKKDIR